MNSVSNAVLSGDHPITYPRRNPTHLAASDAHSRVSAEDAAQFQHLSAQTISHKYNISIVQPLCFEYECVIRDAAKCSFGGSIFTISRSRIRSRTAVGVILEILEIFPKKPAKNYRDKLILICYLRLCTILIPSAARGCILHPRFGGRLWYP